MDYQIKTIPPKATVKRSARIFRCFTIPALLSIAILGLGAVMARAADPRCDGFPPRDHREGTPRGDVVGWVAGACSGQLFANISSANTDSGLAAIESLRVEKPPRYGQFQMTGLRDFRYVPSSAIMGKGWDEAQLRLVYRLPNNQVVSKKVHLRLTTESEYNRMRASGSLN